MEKLFRSIRECGHGWDNLIDETLKKMDEIDPEVHVVQIKEKFGELRIYTHSAPEKVFDVIDEATDRSTTICEICGKHGALKRKGHWYKTRCGECE